MRIDEVKDNVRMYFASEDLVMVSLNNERILTFDNDGYVIEKDFKLYTEPHKILLESSNE